MKCTGESTFGYAWGATQDKGYAMVRRGFVLGDSKISGSLLGLLARRTSGLGFSGGPLVFRNCPMAMFRCGITLANGKQKKRLPLMWDACVNVCELCAVGGITSKH